MSEQSRRPSEARRRYRIGGGTVASDLDVGPGGHVDDLIPGYALGALDQFERDAVDRHLRFCERCAALLAADMRTVGLIPFTMPRATPAPDVKVALFSRIEHAQRAAAEANLPTHAGRAVPPTLTIPASRPLADPAPPAGGQPVRPARRADSRFSWVASALSLPLLMALVASGVWAMQLRNQVGQQSAMVGQLQAQLANFGAGATSYSLSPGATAPQAEGEIIVGADQKSGMVRIDLNSKQTGPASSYEMWVVQDGKLVPATEVKVDDHGVGQAPFQLDQPFSNYESVHVKAKPVATGEAADATSDDTLLGNIAGTIGSSNSGNYALP
ncbi:MAG TPA: zf-HC2 domain-containing protein [Thermomicrobiales bacterium]|nr:zf-HC2 domain-containing protein [Thermomicrobiales bacterium]